jgi:hypothetical protein
MINFCKMQLGALLAVCKLHHAALCPLAANAAKYRFCCNYKGLRKAARQQLKELAAEL